MSDYLQQLERLGELQAKGVLTQEEFDAEKARILGHHDDHPMHEPTSHEKSHRLSRKQLLVGSIVGIIALGTAVGLAARHDIGSGEGLSGQQLTSTGIKKQERSGSAAELAFADASKCRPNAELAGLIGRLEEAGKAPSGAGQLVFIEGVEPAEVDSATVKSGGQEVALARIPLSEPILGLQTTELRSISWPGGRGFRITFDQSEGDVRRAFQLIGSASGSTSNGLVAVEPAGTGSSLTCFETQGRTFAGEDGANSAA